MITLLEGAISNHVYNFNHLVELQDISKSSGKTFICTSIGPGFKSDVFLICSCNDLMLSYKKK